MSAVDALVTEDIAEPKLTSMEEHQICAQRGQVSEIVRTKEKRPPKICHWGTIDLWSFEVLSDHGDEVEDDESTNETTEMMPPLPPGSWFKDRDVLRKVSETLQ